MKITTRTLVILSLAVIIVFIMIYAITSRVFMASIQDFEQLEMKREILRAANAVVFDLKSLERFASDWSVWDESYEFVQNGNVEAYISNNMTDYTFSEQKINVMLFVAEDGQLACGKWYDLQKGRIVEVPEEISARLYQDPVLLASAEPYESVIGLVDMPNAPMMVVSQPIYDSNMEKEPEGHLIVGRYLNEPEAQYIADTIQMPMQLKPVKQANAPGGLDILDMGPEEMMPVEITTSSESYQGKAVIADIHGNGRFELQVERPRIIYNEGMATTRILVVLLSLTCLLVYIIIFVLIKKYVLNRLIALSSKISTISNFEQIPDLEDPGQDEISELALHIISMLEALKQSSSRLEYAKSHDTLTGVHNRLYYEQFIINGGESLKGCWGAIVCDIDGLKLANDIAGHQFGDKLLNQLAEVMKSVSPDDARIARIGGDEFVIIMEGRDEEYLSQICTRIQDELTRKYREDESALVSPTVSIGFASSQQEPMAVKDIVRLADHRMHREKLHRSQSGISGLVSTLRSALGARDYLTGGHALRMRELTMRLAKQVDIDAQRVPDLLLFAEFHDVGKIGVPDSILFKPGPLDEAEQLKMQQHSQIGYQIAEATPDLAPIAELILKHHEWWNGTGYPLQLTGLDIPIECRMLAVIDAWDAMTNDRPYRQAMSAEEALAELKAGSGRQFDPEIVDKFVSIIMVEYGF